ncbi:MAG: flagellar assembly protein FliX [Pseudorhodoplanes sp.]|uniref:flagellar assembly protein FliX n=1 Tax=Pseudorhodoplanes sp. TaxID=1934341 RepID=UPI003D0FAC9F
MRIAATSGNAAVRDAPAPRRSGSGGFSLAEGANSSSRAGTGSLQAIAGIDVLVALQGVEDKAERRRRAVRGGRAALDALDALKLGLLSDSLDQPALNRLKSAAGGLTAETGDRALDQVLAEIDLRVQVEIAKLSRR